MVKTDSFHKLVLCKFIEKKENPLTNIIRRCTARTVLLMYRVPLKLHNQFLTEMEDLQLIRIKNKRKIEVLEDTLATSKEDTEYIELLVNDLEKLE